MGWPGHSFIQKLKAFKSKLKQWNATTFGKQDTLKKYLLNELNAINLEEDSSPLDEDKYNRRLSIKADLLTLAAREESLWRQMQIQVAY